MLAVYARLANGRIYGMNGIDGVCRGILSILLQGTVAIDTRNEYMQAQIEKYDRSDEYYFEEGCYINELSNGAADEDVSIARARVEPGKATEWHSLTDTTERYVILEGDTVVSVGTLPAQSVTSGDVVIIPPGIRQRIVNTGEGDLIFLAICSPRFEKTAYVAL